MLSKNDLQEIRGIVKEEVGTLDTKIDGVSQGLTSKIDKLGQKLDGVQEDISEILSEVIGHHDKLEKRIDLIEEHLDLPKTQ